MLRTWYIYRLVIYAFRLISSCQGRVVEIQLMDWIPSGPVFSNIVGRGVCVIGELRWEVIVRFVDIGGIDSHHILIFVCLVFPLFYFLLYYFGFILLCVFVWLFILSYWTFLDFSELPNKNSNRNNNIVCYLTFKLTSSIILQPVTVNFFLSLCVLVTGSV